MGNRAHIVRFALDDEGRPINGPNVAIRNPGTETLISETVYQNDDDHPTAPGATLTNPFVGRADGMIEFYLANPKRVTLYITKPGFTDQEVVLDATRLVPSTLTIKDHGVNEAQRAGMNFTGDEVTITDDAGNDELDIDISHKATAVHSAAQPPSSHTHGSHTGIGADDHHAKAHKDDHKAGGTDAFVTADSLDGTARHRVKKNGVLQGTRRAINLIEGTGITLTMADDADFEGVDVTIANPNDHARSHNHSAAADGDTLIPKTLDLTGQLQLRGVLSPAQITANQNNYDPGLTDVTYLRLQSDAERTITGLAGGVSGRVMVIKNVAGFNIILADISASSIQANRFNLPGGDLTLQSGDAAVFFYRSGAAAPWELVSATRVAHNATRHGYKGARVYRATSNQSIADATDVAVQFNAETDDSEGFHDNATNNTRLTVPTAGRYRLIGQVRLTSNGNSADALLKIRRGGATVVAESYALLSNSIPMPVQVSTPLISCAAGDYFELVVNQDSNPNAARDAVLGEFNTFFAVEAVTV